MDSPASTAAPTSTAPSNGSQVSQPSGSDTNGAKSIATPGQNGTEGVDPVKAATDAAAKKWKLKNQGQEVEVDEAELVRRAQKGWEAEKRIQEGTRYRQQAEQLIRSLKDPQAVWKILSHPDLGHDPRKLAEQFLGGIVERELMTPEQRERIELREQLDEMREQERVRQEQAEAAEHERRKAEYNQHYQTEIIQAMETSGLPKSPTTVRRMAHYLQQAVRKGFGDKIRAIDVVPLVRQDFENEMRQLIGPLEGDTLLTILGDDVAGKASSALVEKLKKAQGPQAPRVPADQQPEATRPGDPQQRTLTLEEFRKRAEQRANS